MATLEISIVPLGTASTSMSPWVAACHQLLRSRFSDLTVELTAMGTNIEGPLSRILQAAQALHESPFESGVQRVYSVIKIDDRRDKVSSLKQKVATVEGLIPGPSLLGQCIRYLEVQGPK